MMTFNSMQRLQLDLSSSIQRNEISQVPRSRVPKILPHVRISVSAVQGWSPVSSRHNQSNRIRVVLLVRFGERMRCGRLYGVLLQDAAK